MTDAKCSRREDNSNVKLGYTTRMEKVLGNRNQEQEKQENEYQREIRKLRGNIVQEEKKKVGKEIKEGDNNLCVLGQTETEREKIDDGPGKSQMKPKQRRWKHQARKCEDKQCIKKGPILAKRPNGEMCKPSLE